MTLSAFSSVKSAIESFGPFDIDLNSAMGEFPAAILEFAMARAMSRGDTESPLAIRGAIFHALELFSPNLARENEGQIAYYQNSEKRNRGIRTAGRPGKVIRKIIPFLTDSEVATLVDQLRAKFDREEFEIREFSGDADEFAAVYSGPQSAMQNPATSSFRKSLACSCMRYGFDHLPIHPAAAYASPDFRLVAAFDRDGRVAARVLVNVRNLVTPTHAPIYGTSEKVMNQIESYLDSINSRPADSWRGARLLRIEFDSGFIVPYLDIGPARLSEDASGRYLVISSGGEIDGASTSGLVHNGGSHHCDDCGCRLHEDDIYCASNGDSTYCESCYEERFTHCGCCHSEVSREDCDTVYFVNRYGRRDSETWCDDCIRENAIRETCDDCIRENAIRATCDSEYWRADDCVMLHNGDYVSQYAIDRGDYAECEWSEEFYDIDDLTRVSSDCGDPRFTQIVAIHLVRDDSRYQLDEFGVWHNIQLELPLDA